MLRVGQRRKLVRLTGDGGVGGALGFPTFYLPLGDAGAGAVNLVPALASGSPTATFTRASVAWTKLASGLWTQVATGVARSVYLGRNTAVGAYGGYWSELAGTQLVTPTASIRDMTDASWVKVGITAVKNATGIDGVANGASTLTATAPVGTILQTLVAAASARTYSVFLRRKVGSGAILLQQGATTLDVTAQLNSVTYTRVELNANVLNTAFGIQLATSGDAVEADVNQLEASIESQAASSPLLTSGAARSADRLDYPQVGNVSLSQGTCYAELSTNFALFSATKAAVSTGTNGRMLTIISNGASTAITVFDGTNSLNKIGISDMNGVTRKRASSWGSLGLELTGDGLTPSVGTFTGTLGAGPNLEIGHIGVVGQWNGTLKEVKIFPTQVSAAALQVLTA